MITGVHAIIYTKDADKDRAFFRDVLRFKSVDSGNGWLIFKLPPSEVAFHPTDEDEKHARTVHRALHRRRSNPHSLAR